jgi:hypothetical protein
MGRAPLAKNSRLLYIELKKVKWDWPGFPPAPQAGSGPGINDDIVFPLKRGNYG